MKTVHSHFMLNNNIRQLTYRENILELERPSPDNLPLINRTLAKTKIRRLTPPNGFNNIIIRYSIREEYIEHTAQKQIYNYERTNTTLMLLNVKFFV